MAVREIWSVKARARGFTLIELLVVLVILGLLAGLVGPQVMKYLGESKTKTARLQIADLAAAMDLFHLDVGRYPVASEGLAALVDKPGNLSTWNGPYLKNGKCPGTPGASSTITVSPASVVPSISLPMAQTMPWAGRAKARTFTAETEGATPAWLHLAGTHAGSGHRRSGAGHSSPPDVIRPAWSTTQRQRPGTSRRTALCQESGHGYRHRGGGASGSGST